MVMVTVKGVRIFFKSIIPILLIVMKESSASSHEFPSPMIQMKAVTDKILNGYDKRVHPFIDGYNSTLVAVGIIPWQIIDVDEEKGLFELNSHMSLAWEDPRLQWNVTTEYDGILQLPANLLWVPNIIIYNSYSTRLNPTGEAYLSVIADGFVTWIPQLQTKTSCPTLTSPSEMVTCDIKIGSRGHDGWEIDVVRDKHLFLKQFLNINPRWELLTSQTKVFTNKTAYQDNMSIDIVFPVRRRVPPDVGVVRQLCIFVMVLTLAIFWLPPNSTKKVLLGGMLFLILTQLLLYVAWSTKYPLTALFAKSLIQSTMYAVVTTLLLQVLVIFNLCKFTGPVRPPTTLMRLLKGPLGKIACLRLPVDVNKNIPTDTMQLQEDVMKSIPSPTPRDDWMLFATSLDRLFFIVMSIVLIALHS